MRTLATRFLLTLLCCLLPTFAAAATNQTIHAEWSAYTPPDGLTVTGFKLYQEGTFACLNNVPAATSMDCQVTLTADTTNFTLTATFSDGTESPHSAPFAFTATADTSTDTTTSSSSDSTSSDSTTPTTGDTSTTETTDSTSSSDSTTSTTETTSSTDGSTSDGTTTTTETTATNQTIHAEWSAYTPPDGLTVTGFNLYQEGVFACQSTDPAATSMDCLVTLTSDTTNFTLTATFSDGTESPHSAPFTFTIIADPKTDPTAPTDSTALSAAIAAAPLTGTAPLNVSFNAGSSTGAITSALWNFDDGTTATGTTASHLFTTAGTYTVTLTVADSQGLTSTSTVTISVASAPVIEPEPIPATPPSAVVSSSVAAGPAPLQVTFDGSGSTAASGASIAGYAWSFGDDSTATGSTAAHSYTAAGTYTATLTVTDTQGLTNSASTPIVVTAPVVIENKTPTAAATATPTSGTAPLTVSFDGSASADSDGSIATYLWTFGDGSTATGKTASHTYTDAGDYTATLQVTDDQGSTGTTTVTIKAEAAKALPGLKIETGEISVSSTWVRVPLAGTFMEPVVIAGPPSFGDSQPCVVRVRNVTPTGFEIRLAEWDYLDGKHQMENVSYLVMEKGRTTLPDGTIVEAGSFAGTPKNQSVRFSGLFNTVPVVLTTITSENEVDTISSRISKISTASFAHYFREQEKNRNFHVKETVHYIAWEPGQGTIGTLRYEVARAANGLTDAWTTIPFQQDFQQAPIFLADMQTINGTDTAALRARAVVENGVSLKVEEEQSNDAEITHQAETVGYMVFDKVGEEASASIWPSDAVPSTVDAGGDGPQELGVKFRSDVNGYITGIRFYKAAANTGTHIANLWTSTGTLLATATFTNETESGWQEVQFTNPVAITANTVYVASYFCPTGHQSVDRNYFESKGMDSAPLHALASGVSGANGVYAYGSSSVFPNSSYLNTNYWVDVVFQEQ